MRLNNSITKLLDVERAIYDNEGELDFLSEELLDSAYKEVGENLDSAVFAYKRRVSELQYIKDTYKDAVKTREKQLDLFKNVLFSIGKRANQKLQTPATSLSITTKTTQSVLIDNFDYCASTYPRAVTHKVEDNVMTTSISKIYLKEIHRRGEACCGFTVVEKQSIYPNIRVRAGGSKSVAKNEN